MIEVWKIRYIVELLDPRWLLTYSNFSCLRFPWKSCAVSVSHSNRLQCMLASYRRLRDLGSFQVALDACFWTPESQHPGRILCQVTDTSNWGSKLSLSLIQLLRAWFSCSHSAALGTDSEQVSYLQGIPSSYTSFWQIWDIACKRPISF